MYHCQICQTLSKPGEDRLVHYLYRQDKSILREVPVCVGCLHQLKVGIPYSMLMLRNKSTPRHAPVYKEGQSPAFKLTETGGKRIIIATSKGKTKKQRKEQLRMTLTAESVDSKTQLVVNKPLSIGKPVSLSGERVEAPK